MQTKSSTVMARVEPDIKKRAEDILSTLGITSSGLINILYRQIIMNNGIPFPITIPSSLPNAETLSKTDFDAMLTAGLTEAKAGQGVDLEDAFDA